MVFQYPLQPHQRKHGPAGYTDYTSYKEWLRDEFGFRCVYCLVRECWYPNGPGGFAVEHLKPKGIPAYASLICDYENLAYACGRCNSWKREALLLDPCTVALGEHLLVLPDGQIQGLTPEGNDLLTALHLRDPLLERLRHSYLTLHSLYGQQPDNPKVRLLYQRAFGYPDDLPDLAALRPPANSRRQGVAECYYQQRREGRLPAVY